MKNIGKKDHWMNTIRAGVARSGYYLYTTERTGSRKITERTESGGSVKNQRTDSVSSDIVPDFDLSLIFPDSV
jgi:hypothetical protein